MGQSRMEDILRATIDGTEYKDRPQSREEELLIELKEAIEAGGGGGGGGVTKTYVDTQDEKKVDKVPGKGLSTNDYDNTAKGIVDGVTSALADKVDKEAGKGLSTNDYDDTAKGVVDGVTSALADKVDKETGKGLSTNDYDNTAKGIVDGVTAALSGKVDKETGKGLSTNDYTDTDKGIVDGVTTALSGKADVDDVIDGADYDSTNHLILFKNGTTTLFSLDAAAFVKDGMVDTVEITGGNLVITFNTDAGKQAISIPLTDIFDPANYYDKTATDNLLADKADKTSVIQFKTTTETDANNLWEETGYYIVNTSDMTNLPTTDASIGYCLEVIRYGSLSNSLVVQIAYRGNPTTENPIYMRRRFNDVWTDWVAIAKKSEVTVKADKVSGATSGNLAGLDANGNLTDSGKKVSDFGTADEIADIVNVYGSKNLMKTIASSHTQNGITKTVNTDGSFTLNGTATDNTYFYWMGQTEFPTENIQYTYSIETSAVWGIGKAIAGIDKRSETAYVNRYKSIFADGTTHIEGTFTGESGYYAWAWIFIPNGTQLTDVIVKGMIRLASISDNTYVPYAPTNAKLNEEKMSYADNGVLGAKNLLPQVEHANTTMTINGVTITSREDGSVLLNGTSTAAVSYHFIRLSSDANRKFIKQVAGKKVIISGTNVSNTGAKVQFWSATTNVIADTTGKGTTFTIPSDLATTGDYNFAIYIPSGVTVNNVVVYPMLRLASYPDDTYVPYAMTNRELTEKILEKKVLTSADDLNDVIETGLYVIRDGIPTNSPENTNWCSLLVNNVSDNNVQQQLFKGEYLYQRKYSGVSPAWGSWYKFTGTEVS